MKIQSVNNKSLVTNEKLLTANTNNGAAVDLDITIAAVGDIYAAMLSISAGKQSYIIPDGVHILVVAEVIDE